MRIGGIKGHILLFYLKLDDSKKGERSQVDRAA